MSLNAVGSDQAAGLRRLFAGPQAPTIVAAVSNPAVTWSGALLERMAVALGQLGQRTLLVDAAETAPEVQPWTLLDLEGSICRTERSWSYLGARGLLRGAWDAGQDSTDWSSRLAQAAPWADVLLLHAPADDLARLHGRAPWQPLLMVDTSSDSLMQAYRCLKRLSGRGLSAWDLLVDESGQHGRGRRMAASLDHSARRFLSWPLRQAAVVTDSRHPPADADGRITELLWAHVAHRIAHQTAYPH